MRNLKTKDTALFQEHDRSLGVKYSGSGNLQIANSIYQYNS